ncbi:MAG: response regulator [Alphaproteobacteria bacterium]|nr:response regulator [Alphaproteobacteria bacterium]MCB9699308.1 response regulator [Alphaproteobacteria bacterium]
MARLERELARAQARAESADRRARVLYDGSSDPMLEVDGAGVVRGANGAAVQRLGAAVVGKDLSELFRPGDSETVERMFAGAMETSLDRELQLIDGTGVMICGIAPSASGRIVVLLRVRSTATGTISEEDRRHAAVGRMASLLAHELNNPLTVLQIRADLLREDEPPQALVEPLHQLDDAIGRVSASIKTFQRVARPHRASRDPLVVADLVDRAVGQLAEPSRVQLDPIPIGFEVTGDEDALALAIEQLVTVAKSTGPLRLRVEGFNQHVRIELSTDSPMWSGSSRDTLPERSQELALAIANVVVRDHGGEIRTSERDGGGVIRIDLPRAAAESEAKGKEPVRLLVVDDEPLVAAVLADWCLRKGHACKVAGSAEEAMTLLSEAVRYDAVLVDEQLPGASGLQLLTWIARERPSLVDRSALMSGAPPPRSEAGWAFLSKPFTRRQLAELVEKLLSR